ncbi:ribose-phosphate diphosphokinase [Croceimicrobium hydrocarbonivorans]|nr:phosphoribosyltransferase family protein [Croceimicrobium hydrocarbonivorans]
MYQLKDFSDGQCSAEIIDKADLTVRIRGNSYSDLFKAASIKEAWDYSQRDQAPRNSTLEILCLISQRSDRRFAPNESFDLKIVSDFINRMHFSKVRIFHPHSAVSLALINNSETIDHLPYVAKAYLDSGRPLLISPDAGAYKELHRIAQQLQADLLPANKVRVNGQPEILLQGELLNRNCLIVDDIADGGRTFMALAEKLKSLGAPKVFLYVSHAMFHHGLDAIKPHIDGIYCTNSYRDWDDPLIKQYAMI